jgi:hypothetical protein
MQPTPVGPETTNSVEHRPSERSTTESTAADASARPAGQSSATVALPLDLSRFLIDLSIAMHRVAMYPSGHPALVPALNRLGQRAEQLLEHRVRIAIGIARDRLVIDGLATDARHPILRGLAERLHQHQVAALTFTRGLEFAELTDVVTELGQDPDRRSGPLGTGSADRRSRWPHVSFHSLTIGGLDIVEGATGGGAPATTHAELWVGLARAALERDMDPAQGIAAIEPEVVAQAIDTHQRVEAYDQVIVGYLLQIAEELRTATGAQAIELRRRTSMLVSAMQPETLQRLLEMGGDATQRQRFVSDAAVGMAAGAVVDLVKAAAEASSETVSHGLVRLFTKLAVHADAGTENVRPLADSALRDQVRRLMADWELADPTPADYRVMLQSMARSSPYGPGESPDTADLSDSTEPLRVIQMSLELDASGPIVGHALDQLADEGQLAALLDLLRQMPDAALASQIWASLMSPAFVQSMLDRATAGYRGLEILIPHLPAPALVPLFDLLSASEDRHVRRTIFDLLRRAGAEAVSPTLERLDDSRWFFVRNLLSLLANLQELPAGFDPSPWLTHKDSRVRREALRLAVRIPALRSSALEAALQDSDPRIVVQALKAAQEDCPTALVPVMMALARSDAADDEARAAAVTVLARASRTAPVLELLLGIASGDGKRSWRSSSIAPSETQLAALAALMHAWPHDRRAVAVIRQAAANGAPAVRQLVKGGRQ